jgi:hypothetical protein
VSSLDILLVGILILLSWLHRQFLHFDANFKLILDKRDTRGDGNKSLWGEAAYFVETAQYRQYLAGADAPRREVSHSRLYRRKLTPSPGI